MNNETLADIISEIRHCIELASPRQRYAPKISLRAWSNLADCYWPCIFDWLFAPAEGKEASNG